MPLALTAAKNTGDLDSGAATYAQAKIISQLLDSVNKSIILTVQLGNTVAGVWTPGVTPIRRFAIQDLVGRVDENGDPIADVLHFSTIVTKSPQDVSLLVTDPIYQAAATQLYQWLIDEGYYAGTYVD